MALTQLALKSGTANQFRDAFLKQLGCWCRLCSSSLLVIRIQVAAMEDEMTFDSR
ncbi:hypothetical protein M378DRAFT_159684 [Amanita muscaria Koide BX008]|uniref:Uncharacterized protein n=1 Tax=Amanita muscaria (strain Koide BX008) TaxID=946122 RepID=A0A0C2SV22_AMAMK|nr:hypothetical protein M378DRAFT_159684 [Amanita muscaria Koide BX008]